MAALGGCAREALGSAGAGREAQALLLAWPGGAVVTCDWSPSSEHQGRSRLLQVAVPGEGLTE